MKSLLTCSGDTISSWSLDTSNKSQNNLSLHHTFQCHRTKVHIAKWSHNNSVIVSGDDTGHVVLSLVETGEIIKSLSYNDNQNRSIKSPVLGLAWSRKSRNLCCGRQNGNVEIWDIKSSNLLNLMKSNTNSPISTVSYDPYDKFLAIGSLNGQFNIYQNNVLINDKLTWPKLFNLGFDDQGLHCAKFSYLQKGRLCCGTSDGMVRVWELPFNGDGSVIQSCSFDKHTAPVTGVDFSYINRMLLCSCGLDGQVLFYDVESKKVVKQLTLPSATPAHSISFHYDGSTIGIAADEGVLCYDLRQTSQPISISWATSNPYHYIEFSNKRRKSSNRRTPQKIDTKKKHVLEKIPEIYRDNIRLDSDNNIIDDTNIDTNNNNNNNNNNNKNDDNNDENNKKKEKKIEKNKNIDNIKPKMSSYSSPKSIKKRNRLASPKPKSTFKSFHNNNDNKNDIINTDDIILDEIKNDDKSLILNNNDINDNYNNNNNINNEKKYKKQINNDIIDKYNNIEINDIIHESINRLRQELRIDIRNLHLDMIQQFNFLKEENVMLMEEYFERIKQLIIENNELKRENEQLKTFFA